MSLYVIKMFTREEKTFVGISEMRDKEAIDYLKTPTHFEGSTDNSGKYVVYKVEPLGILKDPLMFYKFLDDIKKVVRCVLEDMVENYELDMDDIELNRLLGEGETKRPMTQLEMIQRVYETIVELERREDEPVAITQLIQTVEKNGISQDIVMKAIGHLKNEGFIFEPRKGYVKIV